MSKETININKFCEIFQHFVSATWNLEHISVKFFGVKKRCAGNEYQNMEIVHFCGGNFIFIKLTLDRSIDL